MSPVLVVALISFCLLLSGGVTGNMFLIMMIGEINRKRQDGSLVSYFGYTFPKIMRIFKEYRAAYPTGRLSIYAIIAYSVGAAGFVGGAACLFILAHAAQHGR